MKIAHYISLGILGIMILKTTLFLIFSYLHKRNSKNDQWPNDYYNPLISVLVPCYNESSTLNNCVSALTKQTFTNFEVIIVNDGSTDDTSLVAQKLVRKYRNVYFYEQENYGKASALNLGLKHADGTIVVSLDADSVLKENALQEIAKHFKDPKLSALGGNVKIINRDNLLTKHQSLEYITGIHFQQEAFAFLGCTQVIPGAIAAFRKFALMKIGGYSSDTLVEDMDTTIEIAKTGEKIDFNTNAISYTEAPANIKNLYKQRLRWSYGTFQVLKKHKDALFRKQYGHIGLMGLPYILVSVFLKLFVSLSFIVTFVNAVVTGNFYMFHTYAFFILFQIALSLYSLHADHEDIKLSFLSIFEYLWYNHMLSFFTAISLVKFLVKEKVDWNKFPRLGKNIIPSYSHYIALPNVIG